MSRRNSLSKLCCSRLFTFAVFSLILPFAVCIDIFLNCNTNLCTRWPRHSILLHIAASAAATFPCIVALTILYTLDNQSSNATSIAHMEFHIIVSPSFPSWCKAAVHTIICAYTVCITMCIKGLYIYSVLVIRSPTLTLQLHDMGKNQRRSMNSTHVFKPEAIRLYI